MPVVALSLVAALALPLGGAGANHIRIGVTADRQPDVLPATVAPGVTYTAPHVTYTVPQGSTVAVPQGSTVVVQPPANPAGHTVMMPVTPAHPPMLQAEDITANQVRAHTIYANRIDADDVRGMVHHTQGVKIKTSSGDLSAPEVAASVIYADEIKANTVVAEAIFVRDLRRR
jgi:hypothetical protein